MCHIISASWLVLHLTFSHVKLQFFVAILCFTVSQSNLFLITLDRYMGVNHPLKYRTRITCRKTISAIAITWVLSHIIATFPFIRRPDPSLIVDRNTKICVLADLLEPVTLTCFLLAVFIIPLLLTIGLYLRILNTIVRARDSNICTSTRRNQSSASKTGPSETENNGQRPPNKCKRMINVCKHEIKTAKIVLVQIAMYMICLLPITTYDMYISLSQDSSISDGVTQCLVILAHCSSAINPFLYGIRDPKYKKAIQELFHRT